MNKHEIIIYWSAEDDAFIAEVPELPGCSAYGENYYAALDNAVQAVELWMDTAKEFNKPIPAPKGKVLFS